MRRLASTFRYLYGSSPLHLLTMVAGFAVLSYLIVTATPTLLLTPAGTWWKSMAFWFAAAIVFHDLLLFPVYALADRVLRAGAGHRKEPRIPAVNFIRAPTLGSGLMLLIFFPGIVRQGAALYHDDTGLTQEPFLGRWLLLTAVMFSLSAVGYALKGRSGPRRRSEPMSATA